MIEIELPKEKRIQRLVREYSEFDKEALKEAVTRISEKLGGTRTKQALDAIDNNDFHSAVHLALAYYDKSYRHSVSLRISRDIRSCCLDEDSPAANATRVLEFIRIWN
jgi:tRNA 2-selenouridine synthase